LAARLDRDLQAAGYSTWRDVRSIDPYQDFSGEIEAGIRSAEFVVVCSTPSVESNPVSFVRREILYAQQRQKPLIPLVFPNSYLPTLVNHPTWIPFFSGEMTDRRLEFEDGFIRLTERLSSIPALPDILESADPFHTYLTDLYEQIVAYLDRTVFTLIPLQVKGLEGAVERSIANRPRALPMAFWQVLDELEPGTTALSEPAHDNFSAAIESAGGRVLLRGEPGAGKTTTLMAYAR
jgi:hypothetical protein